ncbi:unnamed protein product [Ectocarpus sp. CCAP 1310/34]|nr:unnamed protein product [Ectocarpus sp. CCAP 1310/34]
MAETVGFIGLGIMGQGMASNLAKAGAKVVVWNRSEGKRSAFVAEHEGCSAAATPKEVVESCELTYLMLSDLEASKSVYEGEDGVLAGVSKGKCLVDCATLTPEHMTSLSERVQAKGGVFLEAPVSGSKGQAAGGTLIFLCGGDEALFDRVKGSMEGDGVTMGKAAHYLGAVGTGSKMKLVVNMTMGTMMNSLTEGIALAQAADLPADKLLTVLDQGAMSNPMFRMKGQFILDGKFDPAFPLKHAQKDMRFAVALGDCLGLPLPVASAANEQFKRARPEHGDEDFCAVFAASKK